MHNYSGTGFYIKTPLRIWQNNIYLSTKKHYSRPQELELFVCRPLAVITHVSTRGPRGYFALPLRLQLHSLYQCKSAEMRISTLKNPNRNPLATQPRNDPFSAYRAEFCVVAYKWWSIWVWRSLNEPVRESGPLLTGNWRVHRSWSS